MQKFNSNIEKTKHEPDKLDDETKLLKAHKDGKWKKGTTLIMGDSILSGLREHKMSHRRSLKVRYFPAARIADMKHYSVPLLMKQPQSIIMHIGTNDAPFLTSENMFKELKELRDFILKFLPDVKLISATLVIKKDKSNANENNKKCINCLKKAKFDCKHHANTTGDHLNSYGLYINGYGTRVLANNLLSCPHAM